MRYTAAVLIFLLVGCVTGGLHYEPPTQRAVTPNFKIVSKSRDQVWAAAIPALGKQFYMINTVDRSSGLVNLSFTAKPTGYIDCGSIEVTIGTGPEASRKTIDASSAEERYSAPAGGRMHDVWRRMSLEGRVNLIFEEVGSTSTKITANVRYIVTRTVTVGSVLNTMTHTVSFNSGGGDSFPPTSQNQVVTCVPTGKIEAGLLALVN